MERRARVGHAPLERALAVAVDADLDWVRLLCQAYLALASALSGRLAACEQRARSTLALAVRRGWTRSAPAGVALAVLATVQFHWNLIDEADATLERAAVAIRATREPPLLALFALTVGRVREAQGRLGEALEAFESGLDRLTGWTAAADLRTMLETEVAIVRAATGRARRPSVTCTPPPSSRRRQQSGWGGWPCRSAIPRPRAAILPRHGRRPAAARFPTGRRVDAERARERRSRRRRRRPRAARAGARACRTRRFSPGAARARSGHPAVAQTPAAARHRAPRVRRGPADGARRRLPARIDPADARRAADRSRGCRSCVPAHDDV